MAKVLLIEDNEDDREIYRTLLYYNGFDVVVAEDAQTGLRESAAQAFDLIIVDVMLPGMNGLVAAQRFQHNRATAHIPVICMSAHDVSPTMVRHAGAREFLPKPVTPSMLVTTIRRYLDDR
jgi:DNA-binding response OmpR family regulator